MVITDDDAIRKDIDALQHEINAIKKTCFIDRGWSSYEAYLLKQRYNSVKGIIEFGWLFDMTTTKHAKEHVEQ